ncbi:uncharacterized protein LOC142827982 [Pelodiscus sinensis]|uniref:uncharacterized protein LOC142827982 n=1 Tax=Pelodiscus sinensis TaxID=13735 RepID=UPI003F6C6265
MSENGASSRPVPNGECAARPPGNKVTVVLGAQWGDEGKGKLVDLLAQDADIVCRCQVVRAINSELLNRIVHLGDLDTIMAGFAGLGFPNCGGALDGTLIPIPIEPPGLSTGKGWSFSIVLQALVDHRGLFTDLCVGWSGRAHDARIFRNSHLYERLQTGTFFPQRTSAIGDIEMPVCIVANAAYPLMPWLMKPYTGHLTPSKEVFNAHLTRARLQVECAFGRLKGRFRCLLTCLDMGEHNIPEVVAACCILHNLVESKGEAFLPGWGPMTEVEGRRFAQPRTAAVR